MTDIKTLLDALVRAPGVSGAEGPAADVASGLLAGADWINISPLGSVVAQLAPPVEGKPNLLLTAHLDQIGLVVTHEAANGFVRVSCVGGVDRRMAAGARVEIQTPDGPVPGVVTSTPPHLQDGEPKLPGAQMLVDLGGQPGGGCLPRPGMPGRFVLEPAELLNGRYTAPALDNRAGCASVIAAGLDLAAKKPGFGVFVVLTSTEETGGAGGATAAYGLGVTHAVVVDVTMGATGFEAPHKTGKMGGGPMIGFAPALSYDFALALEGLAQVQDIPVQREVMAGGTGTDSEHIAKSCGGVKTVLLSIPIRFMHTPAETVVVQDIIDTARLMVAIGEETLC